MLKTTGRVLVLALLLIPAGTALSADDGQPAAARWTQGLGSVVTDLLNGIADWFGQGATEAEKQTTGSPALCAGVEAEPVGCVSGFGPGDTTGSPDGLAFGDGQEPVGRESRAGTTSTAIPPSEPQLLCLGPINDPIGCT